MAGREGYIVVNKGPKDTSLKHWGIGNPFKEDEVKRDSKGQFSSTGTAKGILGPDGKMIPGINYKLIDGYLTPEIPLNRLMDDFGGETPKGVTYKLKGETLVPVSSKSIDSSSEVRVPNDNNSRPTTNRNSGIAEEIKKRNEASKKADIRDLTNEAEYRANRGKNAFKRAIGRPDPIDEIKNEVEYRKNKIKNRVNRFLGHDGMINEGYILIHRGHR